MMKEMNKYTALKNSHSKMVNAFPMGFAFSNKQFEEAKEKLGVKSNDELLSTSAGGFIRKTDNDAYTELFRTLNRESEEAMNDDEYLYQGFLYELGNHEFCITCDPASTLDCFGLTVDEVNADERLKKIFKESRAAYLESCENENY